MRITTQKDADRAKKKISEHLSVVIPKGTLFVDAWDETVLILSDPHIRLRISKGGTPLAVTSIWEVLHSRDGKWWQCVVDYRIRQRNTLTMNLIDVLLSQNDPAHLLPHVRQAIYLDELPARYKRKPVISVPNTGCKS